MDRVHATTVTRTDDGMRAPSGGPYLSQTTAFIDQRRLKGGYWSVTSVNAYAVTRLFQRSTPTT